MTIEFLRPEPVAYCESKYGGHMWGRWRTHNQNGDLFQYRVCVRCTEQETREHRSRGLLAWLGAIILLECLVTFITGTLSMLDGMAFCLTIIGAVYVFIVEVILK